MTRFSWRHLEVSPHQTRRRPETFSFVQIPTKIYKSNIVFVTVLAIQELINHRLARIFICHVKQTFEFALLHFQASLSSAPIKSRFSMVPPCFATLQIAQFEGKENTVAQSAANRCKNKQMARRWDKKTKQK